MGIQWVYNGYTMGIQYVYNGFTSCCLCKGPRASSPWTWDQASVVYPKFMMYTWVVMGLQWVYNGSTMGLQWV
jgi:hypothetical protein